MKQPLYKKIFLPLLLAFNAATQAMGQTFTTTADLNSPDIYHHSQTVIVTEGENSFTADFQSLYNTLGQELHPESYVSSFYLRAYIADKSSYAPIEDLGSWSLAFSSGTTADAGDDGIIKYNQWGGSSELCVVTGTMPTGVNLADYRLIVLVSKIADGYCAISGWGDGQTITESKIVSIVELDFKTLEQALSEYQMPNINDFSSPHVINIVYQGAEDNAAKDLGFYDYRDQITADFGGSQGFDYTRYIHFFLIDGNGKVITNVYESESESAFTAPTSMNNKTEIFTANGYYVYAEGNNTLFTNWSGEEEMTFKFTKPASLQWADIRVVAVMTNDVSGFNVYEGNVLSNPANLKSAFIFSFQKAGFRHYEGVASAPGEWDEVNGNHLQLTHQWTYNKYVKPGETITLQLPIESSNILEPGYFRWYSYHTDAASPNLVNTTYGTNLKLLQDAESGEYRGLFVWNKKNPTFDEEAAVDYKAPATDWQGESIACEVSRYKDGLDASGENLVHEPTLSIRYIYNVYPAQKIADDIMNAMVNTREAVYEDNGYVAICTDAEATASDNTTHANLRLNLQNVSDYYFYPYEKCDQYGSPATVEDFDKKGGPIQATKVVWRVFTALGSHYKDLQSTSDKMYALSLSNINSYVNWTPIEGSTSNPTIYPGDRVYVVAYLSDDSGQKRCPVARFNCRFYANTPPLPYAEDESTSSLPEHRKLSYLRQNYNEVAVLNFDNDSPEATLAAPTNALDNMTKHPSQWSRRFYGFVYKDLYDYNISDFAGLSPNHGDYGLYKSFNVPGVSESRDNNGYKYQWWYTTDSFHDRTYEMTRGSQSGYFLYVDASDEARQIAAISFDGELCAGSTVVISAAVADLTSQTTKPQLLFKLYGVTENASGEITSRKLIHSFATGNFGDFSVTSGQWYQVYLKSTLQYGTGVENYHKFLMVIDNYCENTQGADYAIDDIRIYTRNSSVEVAQTSIPFEDLDAEEHSTPMAEYKVKILHETLIAWLDSENNWIRYSGTGQDADHFYKYFYYRLCKADGTPAKDITYRVANKIGDDNTTGTEWGRCRVFRSFTNKPDGIDDEVYEHDEVNNLYYIVVDDLTIPVPVDGEKYYVSLCWPKLGNEGGGEDELNAQLQGPGDNWGTPIDICSAYSALFEAIGQQPSITDGKGNVISNLTIPCNSAPEAIDLHVSLTVPDPVNGGTYTLTGDEVTYDWYVVVDGEENKVVTNDSKFTYTYNKDDISQDGKLHLRLRLEPATQSVFINGVELELCANPMDLTLNVRTAGPQLELGFKDVTYQENTTRTVRVGLQQLEDMRNEGKKLALPVHSYENMEEGESFQLAVKEDNSSVTVITTNDPTWADVTNREIGKVTRLTADNAIITMTAPEDGGTLHEGYAYELSFQFYDKEHDKTLTPGQQTCYGDAFFTLKIVPEYVTWTGAANEMMSTNWNNDQNWVRSLKEEIYKGADYEDYGTGSFQDLSRQQAYVPMKFTKVTLPANKQSPRLAELGYSGEGIINNGLLNESSYDATEDIEYDLMVRIEKDLDTDYDDDSKNDYDCEKFYGNTCQEIYFKPQAELRHQEELAYERAWMEYEFQVNKWQLLTSPLKNVYSGDMYVPKKNGRQETEAFKDITFDGGADGVYSRVGYPIYQRAWDTTGSWVVVSSKDDYRNDYPADIAYGSWGTEGNESNVILSQWSHSYNDATVAYAPGDEDNGFSLKAHKRDQPDQPDKTLIRLPKADETYTYYNIETGVEEKNQGHDAVVKTEGNKGNLLADGSTAGDYAPVTMTLHNNSEGNDIYLVSNPYMASLDMNLFFEANKDVIGENRKFWTIVDGEVKASPTESGALATIAPGQAFFIKVPGENGQKVKFTTNMVTSQKVDFNGNLQAAMAKFTEAERRKRAQQALVMTAQSDGKKSTAIVRLDSEADEDFLDKEDVETLYDSNLADVPTLYTIAGSQAACVNTLPQVGTVPMGIVCATNTQADVTFSGLASLPAELYLYDRETGFSTLLTDGMTLPLQANAHGRYFLTRHDITSSVTELEVKGIRCYSPAPGQLTITCLDAGNQLESVDIYAIDGKKEFAKNKINASTLTVSVHKGVKVVVVKHTGNGYAETVKVAVF